MPTRKRYEEKQSSQDESCLNVSELHHGSQFHDPQIEVEALLSAPPPKAAKRCDLDSTSQPEEDDDDEPNVVQAEAQSSASVENARCSPVCKKKILADLQHH